MTVARPETPSRDGFAVVTGAGKRLGAGFAQALAADGWFVRLHYNHSSGDAETIAAAIRKAGGRCDLVQADLGAADAAGKILAPKGEARFASLLLNNASTFDHDDPRTTTQDRLLKHYAVNAAAPVLLAQAFAAQLPADKRGLVVNILDQKLAHLNPDFFAYTMAKAALGAATTMLAQAYAPQLRVNAIAPGITLPSADQTPAEHEKSEKAMPLGYGSSPGDLVQALRYLVQAEAVTGQTITVDGGQGLAPTARDVMFLVRDGKA